MSEEIRYETKSFNLESLNEVVDLDLKELRTLLITSYRPHLSVDLKGYTAYVYCAEDSVAARGAFEKICQVLKENARPIVRHFTVYKIFAFLFVICIVPPFFVKGPFELLLLLWGLILCAVMMAILPLFFGQLNIVNPYKKSGQKSFWERNKDEIFRDIIVAIFSSAITVAVTKILGI